MKDPSVETWRAALGPFPIRLREPQNTTDEASELTRLLLETRQALSASQADLTAMQAKHDALAVLNAELKAEAFEMRAAAERAVEREQYARRELATANRQNRILAAENEAALRRLNEQRGWQVAVRDIGITCTYCSRPIVRGQAFRPLADAKGFFSHCHCPIKES